MIWPVLGDVPSWVVTLRDASIAIGAVCGALLTIAAATKLPVVNRPIRWLWRNLVSDPVGGWLRGVLDHHAEPDRLRIEALGKQLSQVVDRLGAVEHAVKDRPAPPQEDASPPGP